MPRLEVFGSAARGMDFDPETSDTDFLVDFHPPTVPGPFDRFFGLLEDLSAALGRPVDLVRLGKVRNEYLQQETDRSRKLVYEA